MADDDNQDTLPNVSLGPEPPGRSEGERYPILVALNGPLKNRTFILNKGEIAIGRNMAADIVVRGAHTSRSHARVMYANIHDRNAVPQCRIYDAGSTVGTFVNDRLVGPEGVLLAEKDQVRVAKTVFAFFIREAEGDDLTRKIREMASRDNLTGLFTRGTFDRVLPRELARAKRYQRHLSLMILDVDAFSQVTQQYGPNAATDVLKRLGSLVPEYLRSTDFVARYGGEEISILLPETDLESSMAVAERLRRNIGHESFSNGSESFRITVSIGVAPYDWDIDAPLELVNRADLARCKAQGLGGDRVLAFSHG
ncbi:MAG TPA: GGDEF domain-containing protein [Sumerlaeia bacterium]|nr:GGDEF domain-containing protein [Sumerlaeia bacterium]